MTCQRFRGWDGGTDRCPAPGCTAQVPPERLTGASPLGANTIYRADEGLGGLQTVARGREAGSGKHCAAITAAIEHLEGQK